MCSTGSPQRALGWLPPSPEEDGGLPELCLPPLSTATLGFVGLCQLKPGAFPFDPLGSVFLSKVQA